MVKPQKRYGPMKVLGSTSGARQKLVFWDRKGYLKSLTFSMKNIKMK